LEVLLPVFSVIFGGKAAYMMLLLARMIMSYNGPAAE
jgi:hypothetical protein